MAFRRSTPVLPTRVRPVVASVLGAATLFATTVSGSPSAAAAPPPAAATAAAPVAADAPADAPSDTGIKVGSVTLTWDKGGDNDLFVVGQDGVEISYRRSTSMGSLTLDDIDPTGPETFNPTSAARGPFQVKVRCFHLCVGSTVTVNAVVRGRAVALGSHTMTAEKQVWSAGEVDFDRWDCDENGTPDLSRDDVDKFLADARAKHATDDQLERITDDPCDPWIKLNPVDFGVAGIGGLFEPQYDAAFGFTSPVGLENRGLAGYTAFLNSPLLIFGTPVVNPTNWEDVFRKKNRADAIPGGLKSQFLAAVPPASSKNAKPSPFIRLHFNLTGMSQDREILDNAIRAGSEFRGDGVGMGDHILVVYWQLYNVIASARDRTICNTWMEQSFPLGFRVGGYLRVDCPTLPAGLPLPGPDGRVP